MLFLKAGNEINVIFEKIISGKEQQKETTKQNQSVINAAKNDEREAAAATRSRQEGGGGGRVLGGAMNKYMVLKELKGGADKAVAEWFYACNIPFRAVENDSFHDMLSAVQNAPKGYKGPTRHRLSGKQQEANAISKYCSSYTFSSKSIANKSKPLISNLLLASSFI